MNWETYTLRYHQAFADGYRYLDKCGEFLLAASKEYDLLPGEANPTSGQLTLPEKGLRANVNSNFLEISQEMPIEETNTFLTISSGLAEMTSHAFAPVRVEQSLFEIKMLVPMPTDHAAEEAMLNLGSDDIGPLARDFDMVPHGKRLNTLFISGSLRLQVGVFPVAFETVRVLRHNPTLGATRSHVRRAERLTAQADRVPDYAPFAIILEMTLTEQEPPLANEEKLFNILLQKAEVAKKLYFIK